MKAAGVKRRDDHLSAGAERRRILAVDYGRKRIGLAISDELCVTARPLAVLNRKNRETDLKKLRQICADYEISRVIVGNPLHITGEAGEMADEASGFAARLQKALRIEVEMVDERLTSWEARGTVQNTAGRTSRHAVDDVAAAVLLRDYLEHRRAVAATPERD